MYYNVYWIPFYTVPIEHLSLNTTTLCISVRGCFVMADAHPGPSPDYEPWEAIKLEKFGYMSLFV